MTGLGGVPVDGSVGAAPVEVPGLPTDREVNAVNAVADEYGVSRDVMHIALAKVHRLIAARVRAEERQRAAGLAQEFFQQSRDVDWGDVIELSRRILAAGSAVPVATPAHDHQPDRACARCDELNRRDGELSRVGESPVAWCSGTAEQVAGARAEVAAAEARRAEQDAPPGPTPRHVCTEPTCPATHHAGYGHLCTVPGCIEDWCVGSQVPPAERDGQR